MASQSVVSVCQCFCHALQVLKSKSGRFESVASFLGKYWRNGELIGGS